MKATSLVSICKVARIVQVDDARKIFHVLQYSALRRILKSIAFIVFVFKCSEFVGKLVTVVRQVFRFNGKSVARVFCPFRLTGKFVTRCLGFQLCGKLVTQLASFRKLG